MNYAEMMQSIFAAAVLFVIAAGLAYLKAALKRYSALLSRRAEADNR